MPAPLYLCLHLRDFAAQALVHSHTEQCSRAMVVMSGEPPQERVFAMTPQARRLGLQEGMSRVQAESFTVAVFRRSRQQEDSSFAELLHCAQQFSPRVEAIASPKEEQCGATLLLDVSGSHRLLGSPEQIGRALWQAVQTLGYEANVASAHKASAALLVARGTEGVTTMVPGDAAAALAPLPLAVLEPDAITMQTFESWGIYTLRQLAELPTKPLVARLGMIGLQMQQLARGECDHLLVPEEEPADAPLAASMELEHPMELLEPLLFLLSQLLEQVLRRAERRALAIASVETCLVLDGTSGTRAEHRRLVHPALPERNHLTLLKLIQLDLEMHPPESAVIALHITAQPTRPQTAQHGFFAAQASETGRMEILLARLRKLVGEGRVGSPELLDSHAPEAFRVTNFEVKRTASNDRASKHPPRFLALRMVRPPRAVSVELHDGMPKTMYYEGEWLRLQAVSGPWRTNGAWWTQSTWSREEWDVSVEKRQQCCLRLAHDPNAHCWYVIGIYD